MRWFITVAAGLLLPVPATVQGQVALTVTVGPSLVTLTDNQTPWSLNGEAPWSLHGEAPWSLHGRAVGIFAGFPVSDRWGIEVGGIWSTKGAYEEYDLGCGVGCVVLSISRDIPFFESTILADRRFELGNHGLHLLSGAFLGYAHGDHLGCDMMERFDFGVAGGARFDVGLGGRLGPSLSMLYTHGLRDIGDNVGFGATRALNLSIGLSYSID